MATTSKIIMCAAFIVALCMHVHAEDDRPFEGLRALVIWAQPSWGWDAAVYGALEERGFDVTHATVEAIDRPDFRQRFDIVATNIQRSFSGSQVKALNDFISQGGALYGTWGGPMSCPQLKQTCKVAGTKSVRIMSIKLLGNTIRDFEEARHS